MKQIDHRCTARQTLYWDVAGFRGGPGRLRANWRGTAKKDLQRLGLCTWDKAEIDKSGIIE